MRFTLSVKETEERRDCLLSIWHIHGGIIYFMKISRDDMLFASVKAFDCDYTMME